MPFAENTVDIIKIALEYITLAVFLLCVVKFIGLRNDYARALNAQYDLQMKTQERLEYGKYNVGLDQGNTSQSLTADMVVEALRKYRDGKICIYVDHMKDGSELYVDSSNAGAMADRLTVDALTDNLDMVSARYHPYLVYDNQNMRGPTYTNEGLEVKGIAFIRL